MDIDEIERVLVGDDVTGTEAWVALGLLIVGLVLYFVVGSALRRARSRWKQDVIPGETLDVGIKLVQILILVIFVGWSRCVGCQCPLAHDHRDRSVGDRIPGGQTSDLELGNQRDRGDAHGLHGR